MRLPFATGLCAVLLLTGCAPSSPSRPGSVLPAEPARAADAGRVTKVLVVVEENRSVTDTLVAMPYLRSLADAHGRTGSYHAVAHPSLPNYLAIAGGNTSGITDDEEPAAHPLSGQSIFDRAIVAGRHAAVYADGMAEPCQTVARDQYVPRHNPWTYFSDGDSRARCRQADVPAGTLDAGALHDAVQGGSLPEVGLLVPDLCHDGHDCPAGSADDYLRGWLRQIMHGPDYTSGHLAVVVTFDEDDRTGDNTVLTTVASQHTNHVVDAAPLSHYSLYRLLARMADVPVTGAPAAAVSMDVGFGL